ncbi:hypothetical protein MUP77_12505 [Candidatus Bathyarchaeota archaeon]|nr:hypothetical protein [Candidatus Bathyarchaeota archaeon]
MKVRVLFLFSLITIVALVLAYLSMFAFDSRSLSIIGLCTDIMASFVLATPMLKSLTEMAEESTSVNGVNIYLTKSMKRDRKVTAIGLIILGIGFFFQLMAILKV